MFSTLPMREILILAIFYFLPANVFNLVMSKILLFGKGLMIKIENICNLLKCGICSLIGFVNDRFKNIVGEKEKSLVTRILSPFFHNIFISFLLHSV